MVFPVDWTRERCWNGETSETPAKPVIAEREVRRVHHGWIVVAVASIVFFFTSGLGGYVLGALQPAWVREFGWPQTWLSAAFAIGAVVPGLSGVLVGRIVDRSGPRLPLVFGAFLSGLSCILLAAVDSFLMFCLVFAIAAIGRSGMSNIPLATAITQWFAARRTRAMTIASTGISAAGVVLVPLMTWLVLGYGWRTALVILGLLIWVCIIPPVWFVMDRTPEQRGMTPFGGTEAAPVVPGSSLGSVVRGSTFWLVAGSQMLIALSFTSIGIHIQQSLIDKGVSPFEAATAVSFLALCSFASRFFYGWIDNLLPSPVLVAFSYVLLGLGYTILALIGPGPGVYLFAIVLGVGSGGAISLQSVVVADLFGARGYGAILGAVGVPSTIMVALGPIYSAAVRDATGSYAGAFFSFLGLGIVSAGLILVAHWRRGQGSGAGGRG